MSKKKLSFLPFAWDVIRHCNAAVLLAEQRATCLGFHGWILFILSDEEGDAAKCWEVETVACPGLFPLSPVP
jgi:hypothetical protein